MADYFVAASGSNTSPYDTWAKAATSLATVLALATTTGDRVVIQYDGVPATDKERAADTTYTIAGNIQVIASTNSGTSTITPTAMGTANWIGNSTTFRSITIQGAKAAYFYGITIRTAGATADSILLNQVSGGDYTFDNCYFWHGNTGNSYIAINTSSSGVRQSSHFMHCTFRFGATTQGLNLADGFILFEDCSISSAGSAPTILIEQAIGGAPTARFWGCDLSHITGTLVPDFPGGPGNIEFVQCKLGTGVTVMAAQTTVPNRAPVEVHLRDCAVGDEHYHWNYYNALGTLSIDTSIYANDGASYNASDSKLSWKIVTTANAGLHNPFITPWITVHHEGTTAITPNLECVRSGSSTAYDNDEVWSEWLYKGTSGSTKSTLDRSDKMTLGATPAAQTTGALGAGDWTGENATSWFGKLAPGASITPAEIGDLCARVCVGVASSTVYVDPQIRGRT